MAKKAKPAEPEKEQADCCRCDGTGQLCNECGESAAVCTSAGCGCDTDSEDEAGYYDCDECKGTGVIPADE